MKIAIAQYQSIVHQHPLTSLVPIPGEEARLFTACSMGWSPKYFSHETWYPHCNPVGKTAAFFCPSIYDFHRFQSTSIPPETGRKISFPSYHRCIRIMSTLTSQFPSISGGVPIQQHHQKRVSMLKSQIRQKIMFKNSKNHTCSDPWYSVLVTLYDNSVYPPVIKHGMLENPPFSSGISRQSPLLRTLEGWSLTCSSPKKLDLFGII